MKRKRTWMVEPPDQTTPLLVQAHTRSEARGQAKKIFRYRGRLPIGTKITEMK